MQRRKNGSNLEPEGWVTGHKNGLATHYEEAPEEKFPANGLEFFMELFGRAMGAVFREIAELYGSPAGIRTPVAGSRVPHAWPLHHGAAR